MARANVSFPLFSLTSKACWENISGFWLVKDGDACLETGASQEVDILASLQLCCPSLDHGVLVQST
jgi:hypothetical protein